MKVEILNEVDAIFNELNESIEINYAIDESRGKPARMSVLQHTRQLTTEEEKNEQFAEAVAKKFGLRYVPESCIAGRREQMELLKKARAIVAKRMEVEKIEKLPYSKQNEYAFVFWS